MVIFEKSLHHEEFEVCELIVESCLSFLRNLFAADSKARRIDMKYSTRRIDENGINERCLSLKAHAAVSFSFHLRLLSQVYRLISLDQQATKRDLYYECKKLYGCQQNLDRSVSVLCNYLCTSRKALHVVSCSRGFVIGNLRLTDWKGNCIDFRSTPISLYEKYIVFFKQSLIEIYLRLTTFEYVETTAKFILIVEKDSVFQRLIDERFVEQYPNSILATGRGYPDICTRNFLQWLSEKIKIPFLALMDADPYGLEIYTIYKYGSIRTKIEANDATILRIQWIGLFPSEAAELPIEMSHYLKLLLTDRRKIAKLRSKFLHVEDKIIDELNVLIGLGYKFEIEVLNSIRPSFLSSSYLRDKIEELNSREALEIHSDNDTCNMSDILTTSEGCGTNELNWDADNERASSDNLETDMDEVASRYSIDSGDIFSIVDDRESENDFSTNGPNVGYCSSSDDEDAGEPSNSAKTNSATPKGQGSNTGPKAVLADYAQHQQQTKYKEEMADIELIKQAKRFTLDHNPLDEKQPSDDDDDELAQIRRQRMEQLKYVSRGRIVEIPNSEEFLSLVEKPGRDWVVIHIYRDGLESCNVLNEALLEMAAKAKNARFYKVQANILGTSNFFAENALPTLQIYRGGKLVGNFVRITDSLGEDFTSNHLNKFLLSSDIDLEPLTSPGVTTVGLSDLRFGVLSVKMLAPLLCPKDGLSGIPFEIKVDNIRFAGFPWRIESKKIAIAINSEQERCNYLKEQIHHMQMAHDEYDALPDDQKSGHSPYPAILEKSGLSQHLKEIFEDVCDFGMVDVFVDDCIEVGFCVEPKALVQAGLAPKSSKEVESIMRQVCPYHGILFLEDYLPSPDSNPFVLRFLEEYEPSRSIDEMSAYSGLPLSQVLLIVKHYLMWARAIVIYPICSTNVYTTVPCLTSFSSMAKSFSEQFPDCSLAEILEQFSPPSTLGTFLAETALYSPVNMRIQMLIFLLRNQLLVQIHTYLYLLPPPSTHRLSGCDQSVLSPRIRTVIGNARDLAPEIRDYLLDLCSQAISSGVEESEVFWLLNSFISFIPFFNGRTHIEHIMYQTHLDRSTVTRVVDTFSAILSPFYCQDLIVE
ncbi:phosducin domain-containing protein [Ditylenchus destructor]|uniref:GATOR complex protein NPRL3 n=1 Tax=Ditylenchus destructor TaxID=166010 RepID=A0AAD4N274_9BILA|nr:phosducin domain-containing protein [Ditylenchus destructor]